MKDNDQKNVNEKEESELETEKEETEMKEKKKMPLWKKIVFGGGAILGAFAAGAITDKALHRKKYSNQDLGSTDEFEKRTYAESDFDGDTE